ncbi:MAG: PhnA domain-containing protein [Flavobacteriaceae bacterium]|nr:PhnA domain-containing protein [Flavobacteriaceae bacterium]
MSSNLEPCELCQSESGIAVYELSPHGQNSPYSGVCVCENCLSQIENPDLMDVNHWRCLNDSMWSEKEEVKILVWRILHRLRGEGWPQDLLDMMYLNESSLAFAQSGVDEETKPKHQDTNGNMLSNGDQVTLIKDLDVKGSSLTAKRGTVVKKINLVEDNPEQIEGRIDGQLIVILTKFVKKS